MRLSGQIAIITGAASGMGAATAKTLAAQGVKLGLVDKNTEALEAIANELSAYAMTADVASAESLESAYQHFCDEVGIPRICINCAGIAPAKRVAGKQGPMPLADFEQVIAVNLLGTFNMTRLAASGMTKLDPLPEASGSRGVIINTSSVAAYEGQIGQAAYSASKGGVAAMTLPIARELAQFGIRVLAIAPGLVATPMLLSMPEEVQAQLGASVPFPKRLAEPREFAELAVHMVENDMLNGTVVRMDGALRMP